MRFVIAYDITDDRRRERVAEHLKGYGRRVQKSVFEFDLAPAEFDPVWAEVVRWLDPRTDRAHGYRICAECLRDRRNEGGDAEPPWGAVVIV